MRAARFVTICFLYAGAVLIASAASQVALAGFRPNLSTGAVITQLGTGLAILATGLIRLRSSTVENQNPAEYGLLAYGLAALCLVLTAIFLAQLAIVVE